MGRITADRVEAAFAKCGHMPIRGDFFEIDFGGPNKCDGLTAVAIAENGAKGSDLWVPSRCGMTPAVDALGLDRDYVEGFIRGWDCPWSRPTSLEFAHYLQEPYISGFDDGVAAQARVDIPKKEAA